MNKPIIKQVIYKDDTKWQVVWGAQTQLTDYTNINHWEVYRNEGGTYIKIGDKDMTTNNGWYAFVDNGDSTPFVHQQQYIIRGIYNNGTTTDFSDPHMTIHLMANLGLYNTVNLVIMPYKINEVVPSGTIKIYKGTSTNKRIQHVADLAMYSPYVSFTDTLNEYTYYIADVDLYFNPPIILYTLNVTPEYLNFDWQGTPQTINIVSNSTWSLNDDVSWITYSMTSGGAGTYTVTVDPSSYAYRGGPIDREATITVTQTGGTIKYVYVYQPNKFIEFLQ